MYKKRKKNDIYSFFFLIVLKINNFIMYEMVPLTGLEPVRYHYQGILSPSRLPIPSQRHVYYSSSLYVKCTMKLPTSTIDIDEIMLIINIINNIIILSFPFMFWCC